MSSIDIKKSGNMVALLLIGTVAGGGGGVLKDQFFQPDGPYQNLIVDQAILKEQRETDSKMNKENNERLNTTLTEGLNKIASSLKESSDERRLQSNEITSLKYQDLLFKGEQVKQDERLKFLEGIIRSNPQLGMKVGSD